MKTEALTMERPAATRMHRFSVDDYYRMAEIGVLAPKARVELLDGQVVDMSPIGIKHSMCVDQLTELFASRIRKRAFVRVQNPMRIDGFNEPEPDLTLYNRLPEKFKKQHPGPEDVYLIVEVGDSSVRFDRTVKLTLYAQAGIPEVWLVDLIGKKVTVCREPGGGRFGDVTVHDSTATIAPAAFPDLDVSLSELF